MQSDQGIRCLFGRLDTAGSTSKKRMLWSDCIGCTQVFLHDMADCFIVCYQLHVPVNKIFCHWADEGKRSLWGLKNILSDICAQGRFKKVCATARTVWSEYSCPNEETLYNWWLTIGAQQIRLIYITDAATYSLNKNLTEFHLNFRPLETHQFKHRAVSAYHQTNMYKVHMVKPWGYKTFFLLISAGHGSCFA